MHGKLSQRPRRRKLVQSCGYSVPALRIGAVFPAIKFEFAFAGFALPSERAKLTASRPRTSVRMNSSDYAATTLKPRRKSVAVDVGQVTVGGGARSVGRGFGTVGAPVIEIAGGCAHCRRSK
jgi:hypothetical protein